MKAIVGGPSSYHRWDQSKLVNEVLLLSCVKDIERHKSLWSFTRVTGEQDRILLRAGIFTMQQDASNLTICPFIRLSLALNGQGAPLHVEFQTRLENHSQSKGNTKFVKGHRGVFSPCADCTLDQ